MVPGFGFRLSDLRCRGSDNNLSRFRLSDFGSRGTDTNLSRYGWGRVLLAPLGRAGVPRQRLPLRPRHHRRTQHLYRGTLLLRKPQDPIVGLSLGPYDSPRRGGFFLRARFPCNTCAAGSVPENECKIHVHSIQRHAAPGLVPLESPRHRRTQNPAFINFLIAQRLFCARVKLCGGRYSTRHLHDSRKRSVPALIRPVRRLH